jgi:hypothetical protein
MLKQLIKPNETGGSANQVAAALLTIVLQNCRPFSQQLADSRNAETPVGFLAQGADEKARVSED